MFKNLSSHNYTKMKALAQVVPVIGKKIKGKSEDDIRELFKNKEKMDKFAEDVHNDLPLNVKSSISIEMLKTLIEHNKNQALKKKKNQKKVFGKNNVKQSDDSEDPSLEEIEKEINENFKI